MHQLILITAMSATTGLFGGGKHCGGKVHHARAASACSPAAYSAPAPCGSVAPADHVHGTSGQLSMTPSQQYPSYQNAPTNATPMMAPAAPSAPSVPSAPVAPPAPPAPTPNSASFAPAGGTFTYQAAYGPAPMPCSACATR